MDQNISGGASEESMDRRLARLAAAHHGVFSHALAIQAGATRGVVDYRVATGRWQSPYPGIYRFAGAPESWRQRLLAACLVAGAGAVASHRGWAAVWRLPGGDEATIEVSVPKGRRVRRRGITVHEVDDLVGVDVMVVGGIPVTNPTRTVIDLAAVVAAEVVEEALDDALRRRLTTILRLRWRLTALGRRGRPGIATVRALVIQRTGTPAPESVLETRLLRFLRQAGLPIPICQHRTRDGGRLIAVVDFAYPDVQLAIEVDGYRWHSRPCPVGTGPKRRNDLTALGWHVIHITSSDLQHRAEEIISMVALALGRTR